MEKNLKQQQSAIVKIALFGAESTGKTTLAKQLAAHYDTAWTPDWLAAQPRQQPSPAVQASSRGDGGL